MTLPSHRLIEANVPRYTSYPTAPHFHPGVNGSTVERWMQGLAEDEPVSLYLHIPYCPYCDKLCWFCACHTKQTNRYEPVAAYLESLHEEIRLVAARLAGKGRVTAIHLGGGSPTMLRPGDLIALRGVLESNFRVDGDVAVSVEIDPNDMDVPRLDALAAIGLTRASLGIQDFDLRVQQAINREQSFEATARVVEGLRARGIGSVNLDLLYGLPHQTVSTLTETIGLSLSLKPDRIALFGYAHVPWLKKHQTMIDAAALPDAEQRLAQAQAAATLIDNNGYQPIGLDHFALPEDRLAAAAREGRLHRNFQGYTDDECETLIGLGTSSVSRYRDGFAQNMPATGEYRRLIAGGNLPIARGIALSADDRIRAWVIERLMCDFAFSIDDARKLFGAEADAVLAEAALIAQSGETLVRLGDRFVVPGESRLLVRTVAARFDRYLAAGSGRHSAAV